MSDSTRPVRPADPAELYDVAILGKHLAAGLLGAVLSAQGVRVLLAGTPGDADQPAGETTVPYTAEVFLLLARRFDVPEIAAFGLFKDLPDEVKAVSGVKKSLGFLYHRPGQPQDPRETVQFHVPNEHGEWHPYRPATDAYAVELAGRYGAAVLGGDAVVADADADATGAWLKADDGTVYKARFVVDASGSGAPLVARHGGWAGQPSLDHRSVVYSAHLTGVPPFEAVVPLPAGQKRATRNSPWSHGTVHHLFDGGWLQLATFGNHPGSGNHTVSATLSLNPSYAAGLPSDPAAAVAEVVGRFPDIDRQLRAARPVEEWRVEETQQRTAAQVCGERWFAFERSAARTDMFLSRDVTMAGELVHALAPVLARAVRTDDYSTGPFERVAAFQAELGAYNDKLLVGARVACRDFRLWNAYSRVWLLWQVLADLSLKRARLDCAAADGETGGDWAAVERYDWGGIWFQVPRGLRQVLDRTFGTLDDVRLGITTPAAAADRIFADLRRTDCVPPLYAFGDPEARVYRFTMPKRLQMLWWVKTSAPEDFRRLLTRDNVTGATSASSR